MQFISYMAPGFPASLFEVLAREIGAEVHFETTMSGPGPNEDPFRDGTYDLGWICSTSFVDLAMRSEQPSVQLAGVAWVPDDPDVDGRPVYFGDLLTAPGTTARSLADLAGKRIGCNDPVSLSGHFALRFAIEALGETPEAFAELIFTGGHHASIDALLAGEIDACVVDSVVRTGRSRLDPRVAELSIIERLGPWPVQPLVARADLDPHRVAEIQRILLAANELPEVQAELEAAALTRLVPVGPDHYASVHKALGSISMGR